jgi:D-3-phosphoglycerate dehydrogenase
MRKPEVLLTGTYIEEEMAILERQFVVHRLWEASDAPAFLAEVGPRIRAIATRGDLGADAALMRELPNLEIVVCFGVGVDAIDLEHARARGIRVTNTPDVLTADVADMGMALLLATARRIPAGDHHVRSGAWIQAPMPLTTSISGKHLGILGLGRVGQAVARRAAGFDMRVSYCNPQPRQGIALPWYPDAISLAAEVDFLMVCASADASMRGLVNAPVLDALGPKGTLINIARGLIVDEAALLQALRTRGIAAAGLDVFLNEPAIDPAFIELDNVVLQPHNASGTVETRSAIGRLMRENLLAHFSGQDLPTPVI